ncbi:MAG: hypothetical protein ACYCYA_10245 [Actinomycetes bacterium]
MARPPAQHPAPRVRAPGPATSPATSPAFGQQSGQEVFTSADGQVVAYPSTDGKAYWRLDYHQFGKRHQTFGGKTAASAAAKLALLLARLDAGLEPERMKTP